MKCSMPLTVKPLHSCGAIARFYVDGHPLCRRHAAEKIFQTVISGSKELQEMVGFDRLYN